MQPAFSPLTIMQEFRRAKAVCQRNPVVRQTCRTAKSSAQVAPWVRPQAVSPKACVLKHGRKRPHRLMARFSEDERETVIGKAKMSSLSVNEFIRASILGAGYVSRIDPTKRQLLLEASRELGHQGNNLNQIAKHLNGGILDPMNGNDMLSVLARSLLAAHQTVRKALTEGEIY